MSRHPDVKWAERQDKVFITVELPDSKDVKVNLQPDGIFTFSATGGADNHLYELKFELHDKVYVEQSKVHISSRSVFCIVEKAERSWWKKLLRGDAKAPHYVKVDWNKWIDEDEENGTDDLDFGGMNFSSLGLGDESSGELVDGNDEDGVSKPSDQKAGALEDVMSTDVNEKMSTLVKRKNKPLQSEYVW